MPGWKSVLQQGSSYLGAAGGVAGGLGSRAVGAAKAAYGRTSMSGLTSVNKNTLIGMGVGAGAGAYSNDGSALQGAMAGAAFGRYGAGAYRSAKRGFMSGHLGGMGSITGATSGMQRVGIGAMSGMGSVRRQMRRDFGSLMAQGQRAKNHIGARLRGNRDVRSQNFNSALYGDVRAARQGQKGLGIDPTGASVGAVTTAKQRMLDQRRNALVQQQVLAMGRRR